MARNSMYNLALVALIGALVVTWGASSAEAQRRGDRGRAARRPAASHGTRAHISHHRERRHVRDDGVRVSFRLGSGFHRPHGGRFHRRWVPGHFERRAYEVLVRHGHYIKQWVPPAYETRWGRRGRRHQLYGSHTHRRLRDNLW